MVAVAERRVGGNTQRRVNDASRGIEGSLSFILRRQLTSFSRQGCGIFAYLKLCNPKSSRRGICVAWDLHEALPARQLTVHQGPAYKLAYVTLLRSTALSFTQYSFQYSLLPRLTMWPSRGPGHLWCTLSTPTQPAYNKDVSNERKINGEQGQDSRHPSQSPSRPGRCTAAGAEARNDWPRATLGVLDHARRY